MILLFTLLAGCSGPVLPDPSFYDCEGYDHLGDAHPRAAAYQGVVDAALDEGIPGVSVAVRSPDGLWLGAGGYADIAQDVSVSVCSRFHLGSVSKVFTATAVLRAVDDGLLSLDGAPADYLPAAVLDGIPRVGEVGFTELLSHHTGIPDYVTVAYVLEAFNMTLEPLTGRETLERWIYGKKPSFDAGNYGYSNSNYLLLGLVLEEVTGEPAYDAIRTLVLDPIGADDTSGRSEDDAALVRGYTALRSGDLVDHSEPTRLVMGKPGKTDGGFVGTPHDVALLLDAIAGGDLLEPGTFDRMVDFFPGGEPGIDFVSGYGLGLMELDTTWGPAWGHYGGVWPYTSAAFTFPEQDTTVVVVFNGQTEGMADLIYSERIFQPVFE